MKFHNEDLQQDYKEVLETKSVIFDKIDLKISGSMSYILATNEIGYSYSSKEDRDEDFKKISSAFINQMIKQNEKEDTDIQEPDKGGDNREGVGVS